MKALLIISQKGFQDQEYNPIKDVLEKAHIEVETAAPEKSECIGKFGGKVMPEHAIDSVTIFNYDNIIVIGGPSALSLGNLPEFNHVIKTAWENQQKIGAICIAPMLLAQAGLLVDKKATVFPAPEAIEAFKRFKAHYVKELVVRDGNMITGNGPEAAESFGKEVVKMLKE